VASEGERIPVVSVAVSCQKSLVRGAVHVTRGIRSGEQYQNNGENTPRARFEMRRTRVNIGNLDADRRLTLPRSRSWNLTFVDVN
jgi:hypothetical protein